LYSSGISLWGYGPVATNPLERYRSWAAVMKQPDVLVCGGPHGRDQLFEQARPTPPPGIVIVFYFLADGRSGPRPRWAALIIDLGCDEAVATLPGSTRHTHRPTGA
jgi:hypothetical protein